MATQHSAIFGHTLRRLRLERHLSQDALAVSARCNRAHISQMERGMRSPSLDTLIRLAGGLQLTLQELIHEFEQNRAVE